MVHVSVIIIVSQIYLFPAGAETTMLVGNLVSIISGGLITVVLTFVTNRHYVADMDEEVWENTRDIDNPLSPWTELYARYVWNNVYL